MDKAFESTAELFLHIATLAIAKKSSPKDWLETDDKMFIQLLVPRAVQDELGRVFRSAKDSGLFKEDVVQTDIETDLFMGYLITGLWQSIEEEEEKWKKISKKLDIY